MYPNQIFLGMGMYEILLLVGFFLALIYLRIFADRLQWSAKLQNLCIFCALASLIGGYASAVLVQACYNALESGRFELVKSTGATFYGGLMGGCAVFFGVYFLAGRFLLPKGETKQRFLEMTDIVAGGVVLAHAFGRFGCLFAGCCHGKPTDAWYGIYSAIAKTETVPLQLFEALFLLALCGFLSRRLYRGRRGNLFVYFMIYAVWRFFIEYFRADDRGATVISFLSPSQLTAVVLFVLGAVLFALITLREKKHHAAA